MTTLIDDFDTLNTEIWDTYDSSGVGTIQTVNGKLNLNLTLPRSGGFDVGITHKTPLDLRNTQVEIKIVETAASPYVAGRLGVAITNAPFRMYSQSVPQQRGVYAHALNGSGEAYIHNLIGNAFQPVFHNTSYPMIFRIKVAPHGFYFYLVIENEEFFIHNLDVAIDLSSAYLSLFLLASGSSGTETGGYIDYIKISPINIPSSEPFHRAGREVSVPDIPPEAVYPLMSNMLLVAIGNSLLSLVQAFKR